MSYLIELVVEHIFVVRQRDDKLHDQLSSPRDDCPTRPPVGVLPADAVVLLVHADDVGCDFALAVGAGDDAVQVLDHAQAVTAELEVVRAVPEAAVAEVERLLAVEGCARVGVGDSLENVSAVKSKSLEK